MHSYLKWYLYKSFVLLLHMVWFSFLGVIQNGHFEARTNFSIEVLYAVSTPDGATGSPLSGFVFLVRTAHDGLERWVQLSVSITIRWPRRSLEIAH
jgi:hypothetical protein